MEMAESATVTSKSMINIPAKIRHKYGIKEGAKIIFLESEDGIILVPVPSISALFGIDKERKDILLEAVRELEEEHRREARE
ncbi:MAG: AbrB/MazE/SpoVT family DNA-binding domain-containing protein [Thaumarchaeota archaeon]|nr:AbrB/MazE/SpoVT family DNA-binding domain-containing protein [Nitrososphaerota archaeon]